VVLSCISFFSLELFGDAFVSFAWFLQKGKDWLTGRGAAGILGKDHKTWLNLVGSLGEGIFFGSAPLAFFWFVRGFLDAKSRKEFDYSDALVGSRVRIGWYSSPIWNLKFHWCFVVFV
jgi:hypothetical protein